MLTATFLTLAALPAAPLTENPVELGRVRWLRDLDAGRAKARETGRPVFLLFQEVPG